MERLNYFLLQIWIDGSWRRWEKKLNENYEVNCEMLELNVELIVDIAIKMIDSKSGARYLVEIHL